jgi:capsular polysaccharide biosynthesis protein
VRSCAWGWNASRSSPMLALVVETQGGSAGAPPGAWRLLETLRDRWKIIVFVVVAALAGALIYVSAATPSYHAEADLLVSPESDPNLNVLPLFRASSDPTQDTQTAALLVHTPAAAAGAARALGLRDTPQAILGRVRVDPIAGSDLVAVIATGSTPVSAAALANAFAQGAVDDLTQRLHSAIQQAIPRLQAQVALSAKTARGTSPDSAANQLDAIRALEGGPDPTIRFANTATAPSSPASPRRGLSLAAAALIGLVLGIGTAFAVDALDPRLRRESQLQQVLDLPVLGRVPWVTARWQSEPDEGGLRALRSAQEHLTERLSVLASDSLARPPAGGRAVAFTAPHSGAGCTTVAVHHAWLLAAGGERVALADGDPRSPSVGPATGAPSSPDLEQVLSGAASIERALVPVEAGGVTLRVLAISPGADRAQVELLGRRQLLAQLLEVSDVVVLDAPPLTESGLALSLARAAHDLVVVVRIGETRLAELRRLGELLATHELTAAGVVVIGGPGHDGRHGLLGLWPGELRSRLGKGSQVRSQPPVPHRAGTATGD